MAAKKGTWIAGAALVGVVTLSGTWFLGISPVLDETRLLTEQRVSTEAQNAQLEAKLNQLAVDSENLPALKSELAELQVGIPATAQVDEFLRRVDEVQTARQIPTVSVEVADPLSVVDNRESTEPTPEATTAPDPAPSASAEPSAAEGGSVDATTVAPSSAETGPAGFVAVPVTITVLGNFVNSLGFVSDLQATDGRLFLVTDLTGAGQDDAEAVDGRPATVRGDVELTIKGNLYVLVDTAGLTVPEQGDSLPTLDPGKSAVDAGA